MVESSGFALSSEVSIKAGGGGLNAETLMTEKTLLVLHLLNPFHRLCPRLSAADDDAEPCFHKPSEVLIRGCGGRRMSLSVTAAVAAG